MEKEYGSQIQNLTLTEEEENQLLTGWLTSQYQKK